VLAVLAAVASGGGSVLESVGVRRAGAFGGSSLDLVGLRRQPIYFLGIVVDMMAFVLAAIALHRLPLFLVQSILAFSVGITATIAAVMGTRLAAAGWVFLMLGAAGLVMLGVSAHPGEARTLPMEWRWMLLGMAVPVAATAIVVARRNRAWTAPVLAFCAGVGFSVVSISARTLVVPDPTWKVVLEPSLWAITANALAAAIAFALALQKGGATGATAVMFTTNTALSSLIGLVYLDDRVRTGFTGVAIAGFVLAVVGAIATAHYASRAHDPGTSEIATGKSPVR